MPVLLGAARKAAATAEVAQIIEVLGLRPGASVLDVFCGPGRHLVPLYSSGMRVVGVDGSLDYLRVAQKSLRLAGHPEGVARLFQARFRGSDAPEGFGELNDDGAVSANPGGRADGTLAGHMDAALWLGSSTGYSSPEADLAVLRWVRGQLRVGGTLVIEGSTLEDLERNPFVPWEWFDERSDARDSGSGAAVEAVWRLEHRLHRGEDLPEGRLEGCWTRFSDGECRCLTFGYRVYSQTEWSDMLHEAGYGNIAIHGELQAVSHPTNQGDPKVHTARSWVLAVASE